MAMRILADENIPYIREAFGALGEVETCTGRDMAAEQAREADVLLVRSITKVNASLLDGSAVKFVATATIGTDHIDNDYLDEHGIGFSSAPGSNAESVAQYMVAALLILSRRGGFELRGKTLGLVGVGNTGSRIARNAKAIGMRVLLNDPPLRRQTGFDEKYRPLDEIFEADFVGLHVPLTKDGADPTYHLADEAFLSRMKPGAVLINTSRGAVCDNAALLKALNEKRIAGAVLDVWENEPTIDLELLDKVDIATPHIAGYSFDGKVRGTEMIYRAVCEHFQIEPTWSAADSLPAPETPELRIETAGKTESEILREAVLPIYPIEDDDARLRKTREIPDAERGAYFDRLRKEYPRRREFDWTRVALEPCEADMERTLETLKFTVAL